jgi:gamma-butyrobetaine dioxygenase/trimethyllysine dioxygenase
MLLKCTQLLLRREYSTPTLTPTLSKIAGRGYSTQTATETATPTLSIYQNHLRLTHGSDSHDYHFLWLNHNCNCTKICKHPSTLERIRDALEIPHNITPKSVHFDKTSQKLVIDWNEPVVHESSFTLEWLLAHSYSKNRQSEQPPSNNVSNLEIDFNKLRSQYKDDSKFLRQYNKECLHRLTTYGAVVVRNRGLDTENIIRDFLPDGHDVIHTHFGRYEDLKTDNTTNKNTDQLGYTNAAVQPHTDQPFIEKPPGLQMLHCITPADSGGDNFIVDARQASLYLRSIDPEAYHLLTTTPIKFHRKQKNFESITYYPLIELSGTEFKQIRYSYFTYAPFNIPFEQMEKWYNAYNKFANIVRNRKHQYFFKLESGDFLLYNNYTMLHAREGFTGKRHVRGIYYDMETVVKKLREPEI